METEKLADFQKLEAIIRTNYYFTYGNPRNYLSRRIRADIAYCGTLNFQIQKRAKNRK